ncbi:C40 family peptidase [Pandoraea pulmonicola]|uniref:Peptidase P60 n=1 Tax=Pandoraea pulmonicola TaxID=93221 RepID=A0AAJ5CYS5_PANPU|nr:C40 family peptidase [Pandoraea pulmonicola]AJC23486.2 peptidase P60 [Pandoraea pulmonicola]SUA88852.1 Probable endopeptidase Spr precursor [Pandoraea pulmonicola]
MPRSLARSLGHDAAPARRLTSSAGLLRTSSRCATVLAITLLVAACSSGPSVRQGSSTNYGNRTMGPENSAGQEEITLEAMSLVGIPYRYGGNTPDSGFDCSGLVRYVVARAAGVNLPRTTADMSSVGTSLDRDDLASGDLIFFNTTGRAHSHVGIYVGQGKFVHAPNSGGTVRLESLYIPYWARRIDGIRRVAANKAPAGNTTYVNRSAPASVAQAQPVAAPPLNRPLTTATPSPLDTPQATSASNTARLSAPPAPEDDPIARFANSSM